MNLEVFEYEGKNLEETLKESLKKLKATENEVLYSYKTKKGKLFKSSTTVIKIAKLSDIASAIKEFIKELLKNMNIDAKIESSIRDQQINIKMYSDNNNILIGRNGQTLSAIQNIAKQVVYNKLGKYPYLLLDVENYKEKKIKNIERVAKRTAKEVLNTKIDATLEDMNSYERRIVHNALGKFKNITTISEGEEPNRHVIIKYKED